jgi:hypothetical protein
MGICPTCGRSEFILQNGMGQECYFTGRSWQDRHPAPMADEDTYMILNHYGHA